MRSAYLLMVTAFVGMTVFAALPAQADAAEGCLPAQTVCAAGGPCYLQPDGNQLQTLPVKAYLLTSGGKRGISVWVPNLNLGGEYEFNGVCATLSVGDVPGVGHPISGP